MSVTIGNRALAARCRDLADQAPTGSIERRAAACAAVALGATKSLTAARRCLDEDLDDPEIRAAAHRVIDQIFKAEAV